MNAPGAYDGIDMHGIPDGCWRDVPADVQREVVRAFPDLRILWNPVIQMYQHVCANPGRVQSNYGLDGVCVMTGWEIIPGDMPPPLEKDRVVSFLRRRAAMAEEAYAKHGGVAALADKLAEEEIARRQKEESDKFDDFLGINSESGTVRTFHHRQVRSRPYGVHPTISRPDQLPVAPAGMETRSFAAGPGKKELARRARRLDASLRQGAPL